MALAVSFTTGCASAPSAPETGQRPAVDTGYLAAEGIGATENEARERARAELSRIFESRIYSEAHDRVNAVIEGSGTESSETLKQQLDLRVRVISETRLEGVELGRAWREGSSYHALAMLDRQKAGDRWLRELEDSDMRIKALLGTLGSLRGRLQRYRALAAASDVWIGREAIVSRLRVVGFDYSAPSGYDMAAVFREMAGIKASMPVYVELAGEYAKAVVSALSEALGLAGFVMTDQPGAASVRITGKVLVEPVELENPRLRYARASVALSIEDAEASLTVGGVTERQRGAHITYQEAVSRALKKVSETVSDKLIRHIEGRAD